MVSLGLEDEIILSMVWNVNKQLQVITDKKIHVYDMKGTEIFVVDTPQNITNFENSPQGVIYIASGDHRTPDGATITAYNATLKEIGRWRSERKIISMEYEDKKVLILTEGKIYLADKGLSQVKERESIGLTDMALVGNVYYGVSADGLLRHGI